MSTSISKFASVHARAELDEGVHVGPFCVIEEGVSIGRGTRLQNNVTLKGRVSLGCHNNIHPYVVIGGEPQDKSYRGTATQVTVGDDNVIREFVTINRASEKENGITRVGSNCFLMACSHVAHDCRVGDHVVMANGALLGGHVHVQDFATLSGVVAVHHFTTIGRFSFVSGLSRVLHDVPPYMLVDGQPTRPRCVNVVALHRNDFSAAAIEALNEAHRLLFRGRVGLDQAREVLRNNGWLLPAVTELLSFVQSQQEGRNGRAREIRRAA